MVLFEKKKAVNIGLSADENEAVVIAARTFARDIKAVFDCEVAIKDSTEGCSILVRTVKDSGMEQEGFRHSVKNGVLLIEGADRRGTIYGMYDISEQLGVSPWYDFGDVPISKKESFCLADDYTKYDYPSVKYRGIFLNDEEELDAWAKTHTADKTIGPELYAKIYELLLRLKANYIWPAMHVNYFNGDARNGELANRMGIVVGTSHCDMLLRSNQNEWKPWLAQKGYTDVKYDYSIEGKNREALHEYWRESVETNKEYDVCYTLGMRGIHDSGFITETIDRDETLSREEKLEKKKLLLEQVIRAQQSILCEVLGKEQGEHSLQTFIPYKEVLDLYDIGLDVPENVTIMWVDDNFGYMRRFPNEKEQKRSGGHGLYYHASYWAFAGMSYLFFNSAPLNHTGNELRKCYETGIRNIWVLNVGALKPLEIDIEYFLRYGWMAGKPEVEEELDGDRFLERFLVRNYGLTEDMARIAAVCYNRCMQLTNVCRLEHMQSGKFSVSGYGDEALDRLMKIKRYYEDCRAVWESLPKAQQDSFFSMVLMKLQASFYVNASFYFADLSVLCFEDGAYRAADECVRRSRAMDLAKRKMIYYYNKKMTGGKWDGILTPEAFTPPPMAFYPAGRPALVIDGEQPLTYVECDGYTSMAADKYSDANGVRVIKHAARGEGHAIESDGTGDAYVEYTFIVRTPGEAVLELYRNVTLNPKGTIRFAVSVDDNTGSVIESAITDEWRGTWRAAVMNGGEKLSVKLGYLESGTHHLRIGLPDRYTELSKLVVYTDHYRPSNMGPAYDNYYEGNHPAIDRDVLAELKEAETVFLDGTEECLERLPMLYADADFRTIDRLYITSDECMEEMAERSTYETRTDGSKNVFETFGEGAFAEENGVIMIECEYALEESGYAYRTTGADGQLWRHTQSESNGGNGIAMLTEGYEKFWDKAEDAPALHYKLSVETGGTYNMWFLVKFDDDRTDSCYIGIDGVYQSQSEQKCRGHLFTYSMKQRWNWQMMESVELTPGVHTLSVAARSAGLRIDRIYITKGDERPAFDRAFHAARRLIAEVK